MSVYTSVTMDAMRQFWSNYDLGELYAVDGIADGVTNTNYWCQSNTGKYVLTIFETLSKEQLPFFINLLSFMSDRKIPCGFPIKDKGGLIVQTIESKPAILFICLPGKTLTAVEPEHCQQLGRLVAQMHLAGRDFPLTRSNDRGLQWRVAMVEQLRECLPDDELKLIEDEIAYQSNIGFDELPQGVIHADLFRDNVLFDGDQLAGVIDFYFACTAEWLRDCAICVNDWCLTQQGQLDGKRTQAFLDAYQQVRPWTDLEQAYWPAMLRSCALRFWLSRLYDQYFPADSSVGVKKEAEEMKRLLLLHRSN